MWGMGCMVLYRSVGIVIRKYDTYSTVSKIKIQDRHGNIKLLLMLVISSHIHRL